MAQDHYQEYISKKFVGLSVVLALVFWACFTRMLLPFVPAETPSAPGQGNGWEIHRYWSLEKKAVDGIDASHQDEGGALDEL